MQWVQVYDPLGSAVWSPVVAGLPIAVLLGLLVVGVSAPRAAAAGLAAAVGVAIGFFKMPVSAALAAAAYGGCFGMLPIGWIVLAAVFLYHLTVRTGQFDVVRRSVTAISPDQRIQALLIAFSFGTFLEGAAGFGTPVAIGAALLIGLGFSPLYAAGLALLANTSPVAFGALGTPIVTLAKISGVNEMALSQMAGRQLTPFSLIIPAWLVAVMAGWKGVKGCWPAILVCGGSFAVIQFGLANWHGPALVDIVGGIGSLVLLTALLRFWQPKEIWRFAEKGEGKGGSTKDTKGTNESVVRNGEEGDCRAGGSEQIAEGQADADGVNEPRPSPLAPRPCSPAPLPLSPRQVAYAWMPWVLLSAMVFLWGWPAWKEFLNGGTAEKPNLLYGIGQVTLDVPWLHNVVYRTGPVVNVPPGMDRAERPEAARYDFNWLSATGTGIFLAAVALGVLAADLAGGILERVCPHPVPRPLGTADDRLHVGPGLYHEIQRGRRHVGLGFHAHRPAVSAFCPVAGLAGRSADRLGHLGQRPVWQSPADYRRAIAPKSRVDRGQQRHGRGDGQDHRRPKHCRGRRGHRSIRRRRPHPPLRISSTASCWPAWSGC